MKTGARGTAATRLTSENLKKHAMAQGADAVGIGSMDRFEGAPPEMDPRGFFPGARSVIGMIFRIPRGYLRGVEEGTQFFQYPALGYAAINEISAPTVLYQVGRFIEDHGYEAAVFRNTGGRGPVSDMTGRPGTMESPEGSRRTLLHTRPLSPGRPAPDVQFHFRLAAFLCGLGEIGYSKMFLSPRFGPLNRQAFLFTDAELEPDPLYDGPPLCNRCMACAVHCPGRCISRTETVRVRVAGRELEWGRLDEWSCFAYYEGAGLRSNPFLSPGAYENIPGAEYLARGERRVSPVDFRRYARHWKAAYPGVCGYNAPKCGGCLRACLDSMERRGVLAGTFHRRFRTEKPWSLDPI